MNKQDLEKQIKGKKVGYTYKKVSLMGGYVKEETLGVYQGLEGKGLEIQESVIDILNMSNSYIIVKEEEGLNIDYVGVLKSELNEQLESFTREVKGTIKGIKK